MSNRIDFTTIETNGKTKATPKSKATRKAAPTKADKAAAKHRERLAYVCGVAGLALLILSGIDCTLAIASQTGMERGRAGMLAFSIDFGIVCAVMAELFSHGTKDAKKITSWARAYVVLAGVLSITLNAIEFASHAHGSVSIALNACLGAVIPALSLLCERFTGHLWLSSR